MKKKNTMTKVKLYADGEIRQITPSGSTKPYEGRRMSKTDWERLQSMTEEEVTAAALSDPDNLPMSKQELNRFRPVRPDVKSIRRKLKMTQQEFASKFLLSLAAVRDWEQGRSNPDHAARALLLIVDRLPKQAIKALGTDVVSESKSTRHHPELRPSL